METESFEPYTEDQKKRLRKEGLQDEDIATLQQGVVPFYFVMEIVKRVWDAMDGGNSDEVAERIMHELQPYLYRPDPKGGSKKRKRRGSGKRRGSSKRNGVRSRRITRRKRSTRRR